jgi:heme-degrading monooxygenase HmoA
VAILDIKPSKEDAFKLAFSKAQIIIILIEGYVLHQLQCCLEKKNRYILLVNWEALEEHTEGFRQSEKYKEWKRLLHHFYTTFPEVEYYEPVFSNRA